MANITLFVPDLLKTRMDTHPEIRWSAAVRNVIERKLDALDEFEQFARKSRLTPYDVTRLAQDVNNKAATHAEQLLKEAQRK